MANRPLWQVAGKRDPIQEAEAQQWIEAVIGERFPPGVSYELALRDGIILCKLMNNLLPGSISKINFSGGDYKFMDNINQFQQSCIKYGVPDVDLFQTVDLFDLKNIATVTMTIYAIGRTAYKHPEWHGPWLGPRPSEENKRQWTEEQLRAGEGVIGLQAGQNKGATQAGQNFGATHLGTFKDMADDAMQQRTKVEVAYWLNWKRPGQKSPFPIKYGGR